MFLIALSMPPAGIGLTRGLLIIRLRNVVVLQSVQTIVGLKFRACSIRGRKRSAGSANRRESQKIRKRSTSSLSFMFSLKIDPEIR